jgi:hypothetical protein
MFRIIGIIVFVILLICSIGGITTSIIFYNRNRTITNTLSIYIDEYGKLRDGFTEAKQLIRQLGERNRTIAEAAKQGLAIIESKLMPKN